MTTQRHLVETELLPIHERRTLGGPKVVELRRTVDCPRRACSVELSDCAHCDFGQVVWTDGSSRAQVQCSHPGEKVIEPRPVSVDAHTLVKSIMSAHVICVHADASLETIATLFLEDGVTAVPVTDPDGRPIGMVSKTDLLREVQERGSIPEAPNPQQLPRGFHEERIVTDCAGEVMTPLVFAVLENATVAQAISLMAFERVHHAPVVTADGCVVGVLSSMDVMHWLAASLQDGRDGVEVRIQ